MADTNTWNNIREQRAIAEELGAAARRFALALKAPIDADALAGVPEEVEAARDALNGARAALGEATGHLSKADRIYYDDMTSRPPSVG